MAATKLRANMIEVWVDQLPIPADNAPDNAYFSQFVTTTTAPINGPAANYTFRVPVFAGSHQIGVALCNAQNNQLNPSDVSQPQGVHGERLIIAALGTGIPAEPSTGTLRDPYNQPGSSLHFMRCAIGSNASWGNGNQAISSGSYNTNTGVITIFLAAASPFVANQPSGVALTGLTGTGANLATLNGNWPCLTSSGTTITLQGPANEGAITITGGNALDADVNVVRTSGSQFNFSIGSFSNPFWQGNGTTNPAGTYLLQNAFVEYNLAYGSYAVPIAHLPTNMQAAGGSDGAITIADAANKRYFYSGSNSSTGSVVSGQNVTVGIGGITDSYQLNHAISEEYSGPVLGSIRLDDINVGAINHSLAIGWTYAMCNSQATSEMTDTGWPVMLADYNAQVHPVQNNSIASGTYNTSTGAIALTMVLSPHYPDGSNIYQVGGAGVQVTNLTGTGASLSLLNSVFTIASISGSIITLNGPTGLGTITITGGLLSNLINWLQWGALLGIPASTPKPGGLNTGASMLWDCAQKYGFIMEVQAGVAYTKGISGYADPVLLTGNATMTQINNAFGTILAACSVMRNNTPSRFLAGTPTFAKGGGTPLVAQQAGLVARSTYPVLSFAPPPPSGSTPFQIANQLFTQAPGAHFTTTTDAPIGSLIIVLLRPGGVITSITDSGTGGSNTYQQAVASAISAPNTYGAAIWYALNTAHDLPAGGTITVNGGSPDWSGIVYAATGATGGLDRTAASISTTGVTSVNLPLGAISQANEICIGMVGSPQPGVSYVSSVEGWNSSSATVPELWNGTFMLASDLITSSIPAGGVSYTPHWSSGFPAPYAAAACSFVINASGPGTGLVAASAFLPTSLPQVPVGSTAAGSGFHLTARPWGALNIPASSYLSRAIGEATFWSNHLVSGHLQDPYQLTTSEADRGKTALTIGIVANAAPADGGTTSLVASGKTIMDANVLWYVQGGGDPNWAPQFYLETTFDAIPLYRPFIGSFGITTSTLPNWYSTMNVFYNVGALSNQLAYQDNGLWSAHQDIVNDGASLSAFTNAVATIGTTDWPVQLNGNGTNNWGYAGAIAPFDVYRDFSGGGAPNPDTMCVEVAGRGNYTLMISAGYNGTSATQIDQLTTTGNLTSLLTQDPSGQNAAGGRQSNQNWIDAAQQTVLEAMAQKFAAAGGTQNTYLAGQFQHAAQLNFNNVNRWPNPQFPGTFFVQKNRFSPGSPGVSGIGVQATYQFMYNTDIGQYAALSYLQRKKSSVVENPCPSEIGGYALRLPLTDTYAFANAGGTHIQIALSGYTATDFSGNYWVVPGFQRIGRVNWETRLGPSDGGWLGNNAFSVSFAPTWFTSGAWTRLAQNHSATGSFSTTFVSPGLVMCQVVWTVSGGTFTQNITVTPDGVLVQTTQTGFTAGNWGMTFPILTSDGNTAAPNTWGATNTVNQSFTQPIASCAWPGSLDSQNYMTISANPTVFTSEANCQTACGNVTPVRAVVAADTTLNVFVHPASNSDPSAASVRSSLTVTGPNTFTCTALGLSVTSSQAGGTVYIGRTSASGWARTFTLSGGAVTFNIPCFFIAQVSGGVVHGLEVDRNVNASVQGNAAQNLTAYTPVSF